MRTGFNGFGTLGSVIVADEPMASLYAEDEPDRSSSVVTL
jgi:ornithine decarboxylase